MDGQEVGWVDGWVDGLMDDQFLFWIRDKKSVLFSSKTSRADNYVHFIV